MRLIQLVTENFKKLGNFTANFSEGLNVIAGDNARGKSTVLQAIRVALFGVSMIPVKKENIATWGQKKWSVELLFRVNGTDYLVTRSGTTAKLVTMVQGVQDKLIANGTTPVTAAVEELLGLAAKDWTLFVESVQSESTGVLTFGATALNRKVEEFAGVDLIDKIQAKAQTKATLHASYAEAKRVDDVDLDSAAIEVAAQRTALQVETEALNLRVRERDEQKPFTDCQPTLDPVAMRNEQRDAERLASKLDVAEAARDQAAAAVKESNARLGNVTRQDEDVLKGELEELKAQGKIAAGTVESIKEYSEKLRSLETKLEAAQSRAKDAVAASQVHEATVPEAGNDEAALAAQLEEAEIAFNAELAKVGELDAKVTSLKALAKGGICPTCGVAKEGHDPAKLAAELEAAQKAADEARPASVAASAKERSLRSAGIAAANYNRQRADHQANVKAVEEKMEAANKAFIDADTNNPWTKTDLGVAEASVEQLRTDYAAKKAALDGVVANNQRFDTEQRAAKAADAAWEAAKEAADALAAEYEALPEPPTDEAISEAEQAITEFKAAERAWSDERTRLLRAIDDQKAVVGRVQERLDSANAAQDKLLAKVEDAKADLVLAKQYTRLVQFLRERRQQYLADVWGTIMGISSKIVREASKGLITAVSNIDGEFHFEEDGIVAPATSASGAQKSFIGTALRVGLARALYGSDSLLMFDEPTESCSEHNASGMTATLTSAARQMVLITHRESDQALAENIINVGE